jgi:hypothetical protein
MTPDTTMYMLAGFTVILAGILIYVLTLSIRNKSVKKKSKEIQKLLENTYNIEEKIQM